MSLVLLLVEFKYWIFLTLIQSRVKNAGTDSPSPRKRRSVVFINHNQVIGIYPIYRHVKGYLPY